MASRCGQDIQPDPTECHKLLMSIKVKVFTRRLNLHDEIRATLFQGTPLPPALRAGKRGHGAKANQVHWVDGVRCVLRNILRVQEMRQKRRDGFMMSIDRVLRVIIPQAASLIEQKRAPFR